MGGGVFKTPFRFSRSSEKTAALRAAVFCMLISHPFRTFPENFVPGHLRSGQVTLPPKKLVMAL